MEVWEEITIPNWREHAETFATLLNEKLAEIPDEWRSKAIIRFITDPALGVYMIQLKWLRTATQADIDKQNALLKAEEDKKKNRELEELAKLKEKYEA